MSVRVVTTRELIFLSTDIKILFLIEQNYNYFALKVNYDTFFYQE
jgi:hypothetical protein